MVLRLSPQASSTMTPPSEAPVNGVHLGRPSPIRLESNASGRDRQPDDENRPTRSHAALNGVVLHDSTRQPSEQQLSIRSKLTTQLTNGFHRTASMGNDIGESEQEADAQDNWQMRHGWEDQFNSEEYLSLLSSVSWTSPSWMQACNKY